ncbi:MAG: PfkB family carbohydrate kinase [Gemmatimonadota bacterium]
MRLGIVGSLVWDVIYGRDPADRPVEEWGGIAYALAGLDASLPPGWEIVPLIKVGQDLSAQANELMRSFTRLTPGARFIEVPVPNNRVTLRYQSAERRAERMSGGVPPWTWAELGPMVRDLDAVYVNFISGFELGLGTAQALRQAFHGPLYADLHSLFLGMPQDGIRVLQPLPDAAEWLGCFDAVQLNDDEMRQLSSDPLSLAADALAAGVSCLVVTLGPRGAVYFAAPGFDGWKAGQRTPRGSGGAGPSSATIRTALVAAPTVENPDPTGCGDVFGATMVSRLLAGDDAEQAAAAANRMAARNAGLRGATGLSEMLRGRLVVSSSKDGS